MNAEEKIVAKILERFPVLEGHVSIQRNQRVVVDYLVRRDFEKVLDFLAQSAGFTTFHLVIGVDNGDNLGFIYVLSNEENVLIFVKQKAPKARPNIKSICSIFPNALWHERELVDLFGAVVEELPPGPRYPLPDLWPAGNYPMRKEWNPAYLDKKTMTYRPPTAPAEGGESK
ncbi:MAG: NADH-quinone oxidoreductase subunit C [Bacillota bacterium]|nr:NADH-quinone oxidoreductase subunit C [Bacillota bacterium]